MCELSWLVADEKINTREEAREIFEHEVREYATELKMTEQGARALLKRSLLRLADRATTKHHDKIIELFQLPKGETPIDPTPETETEMP
jgi:hypothetical protein